MSPGSATGTGAATASAVTTHVLDTARGQPAAGVAVRLEFVSRDGPPGYGPAEDGQPGDGDPGDGRPDDGRPDEGWPDGRPAELGRSVTDADGRARDLGPATLPPGVYRLIFDTGAYFAGQGSEPAFFPEVAVTFRNDGQSRHHHVPLLLSPFAYSTYRGS
jgi:5-hydroxyisourate hydrolase